MIRLVLTFLESSLVILGAQHYHFIDKDRLQVSPWQKAENGFIRKSFGSQRRLYYRKRGRGVEHFAVLVSQCSALS